MITERDTEKVSDNQTVTVSECAMDTRTRNDACYSAERATCSPEYRDYLERVLCGECAAMPEEDYEDMCRFSRRAEVVEGEEARMAEVPVAPAADEKPQVAPKETVRVFNQKRAIWLAVYILLAIGVVLALLFTMPGTAWERKSITIDNSDIMPTAMAEQSVDMRAISNTICTPDGQYVTVELAPYEEKQPETNWFDRLCDWLNNAIGG